MGIKVIGTLGVLLLSRNNKFITSDVKYCINTLITQHNMFISKTILEKINEAIDD